MNHDPHAYTITIQKVQIDGDDYFESTIKELPDVAEYGKTYQEVYKLAIDTIETTAVMLEEAGREMPSPMIKHEDFSGRVTLRMAKSLHARAAAYADNEGVSLNQFINTAVGQYMTGTLTMRLPVLDEFERIRNSLATAHTTLVTGIHSNTAHEKEAPYFVSTRSNAPLLLTSDPLTFLTELDSSNKQGTRGN